jgi:2-desacetyl-2-hydroxyethyl bacteriochlorophyllide A dehydrogenase
MGGPSICPTTPHPITGESVPVTFGHEFSGLVEEVGEGVERVKVGDRVAVQPIIYDGTCGACQEKYINCCYSGGFIGLSGWGGGLAEHVVAPEASMYKLPENIPMEIGALVEPLAVGWHAVKISPYKPGDSVLILGGGPIGLAVIQALKAKNPARIIVSEVSPRRKEYARQFGADVVLDPTQDDVVKECKRLCNGVGPDVAFDAAGVQSALVQAIQAIRAHGTLVNIAVWEKQAQFHPNMFLFQEKRYMGIATYVEGDFEEVIGAISSGKIMPQEMITKRIRLDDVVEEGFKTLIKDRDNQVKILVEVGG